MPDARAKVSALDATWARWLPLVIGIQVLMLLPVTKLPLLGVVIMIVVTAPTLQHIQVLEASAMQMWIGQCGSGSAGVCRWWVVE